MGIHLFLIFFGLGQQAPAPGFHLAIEGGNVPQAQGNGIHGVNAHGPDVALVAQAQEGVLLDLNMDPLHNQEGMDDIAGLFLPDLNMLAQDDEMIIGLEGNQELNGNEGNDQEGPISMVLNSFEQSISDAGEEIE
jgi:hypothetical protein